MWMRIFLATVALLLATGIVPIAVADDAQRALGFRTSARRSASATTMASFRVSTSRSPGRYAPP
jgi:hypothetical protein